MVVKIVCPKKTFREFQWNLIENNFMNMIDFELFHLMASEYNNQLGLPKNSFWTWI